MRAKVKLYGTLRRHIPDYQHAQGIEVEIPDGATAKDLLALLEIPKSRGAVVIAGGRILKVDDIVPHGVPVNIVQTIGGG